MAERFGVLFLLGLLAALGVAIAAEVNEPFVTKDIQIEIP